MNMLSGAEIDAVPAMDARVAALWPDVERIADKVHASTGAERGLAWHHLLLAAVNFKARLKVYPPAIPEGWTPVITERETELRIPVGAGTLVVRAEDSKTWPDLKGKVRGLGIPRTTALLSALWPGRHVIMDWRALSAALALTGARQGWDRSLADPASTKPAVRSWASYSWYRTQVIQCAEGAGRSPLSVERALYQLGRKNPVSPGPRTRDTWKATWPDGSWKLRPAPPGLERPATLADLSRVTSADHAEQSETCLASSELPGEPPKPRCSPAVQKPLEQRDLSASFVGPSVRLVRRVRRWATALTA